MGWPEDSAVVKVCYNMFALLDRGRSHGLARRLRVGQRVL